MASEEEERTASRCLARDARDGYLSARLHRGSGASGVHRPLPRRTEMRRAGAPAVAQVRRSFGRRLLVSRRSAGDGSRERGRRPRDAQRGPSFSGCSSCAFSWRRDSSGSSPGAKLRPRSTRVFVQLGDGQFTPLHRRAYVRALTSCSVRCRCAACARPSAACRPGCVAQRRSLFAVSVSHLPNTL